MAEQNSPTNITTTIIDPLKTSQPNFRSGTYVVQVPKDQIYRLPPPEHAALADRLRNNIPIQKKPTNYSCLCIIIIPSLVIILIVGLILGLVFKRQNPIYHIEHAQVHVKNSEYDILLKVENPNPHTSIFYGKNGDASLSFRHKEIACGKYPNFDQGPKNSTIFKMILHGSKIALPEEMAQSMNHTKKKAHISLSLSINVSLRMKIGALKIKSKKIAVGCSLILDTLAENSRVLSQECST